MEIDWSRFDRFTENTCACRCGAEFRSHTTVLTAPPRLVSRKPCPGCGQTENLRRASSDPEEFVIEGASAPASKEG